MLAKTFAAALILSASVANAALVEVCANVGVAIPKTTLPVLGLITLVVPAIDLGSLCLCEDVVNGGLTADSQALIKQKAQGTGLLGSVGSLLNGAVGLLEPVGLTNVQGATSSCVYPDNATAGTCSSVACSFTCDGVCDACPNGRTLTLVSGSTYTCATTSASQRRRRVDMHARALGACPARQTACGVPGSARAKTVSRAGFECIDTQSNIESCGGCRYSLVEGEAKGQDCTELPNTNSVACVNGSCVIHSCRRGFTASLDGASCVRVSKLESLASSAASMLLQVK